VNNDKRLALPPKLKLTDVLPIDDLAENDAMKRTPEDKHLRLALP